jgi:hypothetical protein
VPFHVRLAGKDEDLERLIQRIDTHQHLFYPDRFAYDWAAGFPAFKDKAFTAEDYRTAAATCPLAGAIFMEVDVREGQGESEAAFFSGLADDPASGILGVIAAARPEWEDFSRRSSNDWPIPVCSACAACCTRSRTSFPPARSSAEMSLRSAAAG